ncbi:hypothetical protein COU76_06060, partial [Candidatus Peregrinibacteria bacterium CG10_big_fil_rev_8_21_14_0_10_49_10]
IARPGEAPMARGESAPIARPGEAPMARGESAPIARPGEAPMASPGEAPVARGESAPLSKPDEAPIASPGEAPVARGESAPILDTKPVSITKVRSAFTLLNLKEQQTLIEELEDPKKAQKNPDEKYTTAQDRIYRYLEARKPEEKEKLIATLKKIQEIKRKMEENE